jgi:hypothetical protein
LRYSVIGLLCITSASAVLFSYGIGNIQARVAALRALLSYEIGKTEAKVSRDTTLVPWSAEQLAHKLELKTILTRALFYHDKDQEYYRQALRNLIEFMDQHPDLLDPVSASGFAFREAHLATLDVKDDHADFARSMGALIVGCRRKLEEYDQLGVLDVPLQRDVILVPNELMGAQQNNPRQAEMTKSEERKFVFQELFKAHLLMIDFYIADSPAKSDAMADETAENLLAALEAEFGTSYERLPTQGRKGEIDRVYVFRNLSFLRRRFESNTSLTYSPELALQCLRPITEIWPSLEPVLGLTPCQLVHTLQSIAQLVLDLACESAPDGLLITTEDRRHLEEAKRIQRRVLELAAAVDPAKRDKICDSACAEGLISMAKIAWRYGEEKQGDQELQKASLLADAINNHLLKEVIRRIDKHPSKTPMKQWEPVSGEECLRLIKLGSKENTSSDGENSDAARRP